MAGNKGGNTAAKALELAKPLADSLGLSIWDVVFEKEGAAWYLRVFIDKEGGVDLEDCERFSRPFNTILDEKDFISQSYIFEVGSPGLERELRKPEHFQRCVGQKVKARLYRSENGVKEVAGVLMEKDKESLLLRVDGTMVRLPMSEVSRVQLMEDIELPGEREEA